MLAVDSLFLLMLASGTYGWRQGYATFDVTTAVWVIVMVAILLVTIEPWPVRHAYW